MNGGGPPGAAHRCTAGRVAVAGVRPHGDGRGRSATVHDDPDGAPGPPIGAPLVFAGGLREAGGATAGGSGGPPEAPRRDRAAGAERWLPPGVCVEVTCWSTSLAQSARPASSNSAASTFTSRSQILAATATGTCRSTSLPLRTSTTVMFTRPPVMTGAAESTVAGTGNVPAAAVTSARRAFASRSMRPPRSSVGPAPPRRPVRRPAPLERPRSRRMTDGVGMTTPGHDRGGRAPRNVITRPRSRSPARRRGTSPFPTASVSASAPPPTTATWRR